MGSSWTAAVSRMSLGILPPQLDGMRVSGTDSNKMGRREMYVNFTPHRFGARCITASMVEEDMSCPPALVGKLYSSKGIWCCVSYQLYELHVLLSMRTGEASQMSTKYCTTCSWSEFRLAA